MASSLMFLVARRRCMLLVPADLRKIPPDHLRRRTTAGKKRNCCTPVKKALHLNSLCNRLVCFANQHAKNMPYGENIARNKGNGGWAQLYTPDKCVSCCSVDAKVLPF